MFKKKWHRQCKMLLTKKQRPDSEQSKSGRCVVKLLLKKQALITHYPNIPTAIFLTELIHFLPKIFIFNLLTF